MAAEENKKRQRNEAGPAEAAGTGRHTILVTGGAGFIGTNLCRRLLAEGHQVWCLDNLLTGSQRNVEELEGSGDFHFLRQDVTAPFGPELEAVPFDRIYHLACPASPVHYQQDPVYTARINFEGTLHALELARKTGARLLLSSTSEVYGEPLVHPQPETYRGNVNPDGIRACYDEGKRIAETLCFDYQRHYGTDVRVVRIFNTYGPCMDPSDGRVISNLIMQALKDEPLTIYGDGTQTRCFCFIDDLVEALIRMMEQTVTSGPVNLGNPQEISMNTLAETIQKLTGCGAGIVYQALPQDDPTRRRPDISLAKELLGWTPRVLLAEGLMKTITYYRKYLDPEAREHYHIGLVMGVFDLFHIGHLNLIRRARACCDYLRVGVLSDDLVRKYKGISPTIPQAERMEILRALREVDEVVPIDDEASRILEWQRRPFDCFFSGDDYEGNEYWEWERQELRRLGADLKFFPYTRIQSSTNIRNQLKKG